MSGGMLVDCESARVASTAMPAIARMREFMSSPSQYRPPGTACYRLQRQHQQQQTNTDDRGLRHTDLHDFKNRSSKHFSKDLSVTIRASAAADVIRVRLLLLVLNCLSPSGEYRVVNSAPAPRSTPKFRWLAHADRSAPGCMRRPGHRSSRRGSWLALPPELPPTASLSAPADIRFRL